MKFPLRETVITVACVSILAGLGTWQVQRLHWKNGIIEKLNEDYANAAKSDRISKAQLAEWSQEDAPIGYGKISGHLQRDKAILLGPRMEDGRMGYHLLLPLELEDGHTLVVNTGWVNDLWKDNIEDRLSDLPQENVTLRGVIHRPDWSSFASKNSPANDLWFRADIGEMAVAKDITNPYPFILYVDSITPSLNDVTLHETGWLPRNKHLQYALFWYALGIVMLGVYGFYVYGRNKKGA